MGNGEGVSGMGIVEGAGSVGGKNRDGGGSRLSVSSDLGVNCEGRRRLATRRSPPISIFSLI